MSGRLLCVLARFMCRMCIVQREKSVSGSFTRVFSPAAYRTLTVLIHSQHKRVSCSFNDLLSLLGSLEVADLMSCSDDYVR
jgi:hypothetical protein